jgi:hypothetical protein
VGSSGITTRRRTVSSPCSTSTFADRLGDAPLRVALGDVGVLGLDLDADIDLVGRLALARLEELEVADELAGCEVREAAGLVGVGDLVVEERRVGDDVRLLTDRDLLDREAPRADDEQVVAAVGVAARLPDLGRGPDRGERDRAATHLVAVADQDDPERRRRLDAMPDQLAVALLEDVERESDSRAEDRVKRKQRQPHVAPV